MASTAGVFDHVMLQDVQARWVRDATVLSLVAGVAAGVATYLGVTSVWPLAAVGGAVLLGAAVRVNKAPRATWLVLAGAAAVAGASPWGTEEILVGLVAALGLAGTASIAAFEPRGRGLAYTGALFALLGVPLWFAAPGVQFAFIFGPIAAAALTTRPLLGSMRERMAERGEAARSHDLRFRDLFDRMPVGLYRTGLSGEILDANPALADLLGADREELIGATVHPFLLFPEDLSRIRETVASSYGPVVTDIRMVKRDGSLIWVRDRTRAVLDEWGQVKWYEGELQDITAQVEQVERLQRLVQSKSELIAAVSHELRTPLTAVVGFLDVLSAGEALDGAERDTMMTLAVEEAHDLTSIVEDLLTAARLDNSELVIRRDELEVADAVGGAVRSMGSPTTLVRLAPGLRAHADANRVRQILRNLIGNAVRYGREPLHILADAVDGVVRIIVADRGDAIPDEVAEQMFEPFFTTGRGETNQPGSIGLGLAVSRRLAGLMGGNLRYERVDTQNRFILELPLATEDRAA